MNYAKGGENLDRTMIDSRNNIIYAF